STFPTTCSSSSTCAGSRSYCSASDASSPSWCAELRDSQDCDHEVGLRRQRPQIPGAEAVFDTKPRLGDVGVKSFFRIAPSEAENDHARTVRPLMLTQPGQHEMPSGWG